MRTRFALLVLVVLTFCVGLGAADDPLVGNWKLNAVKSKFSPPPPPQDMTVKYEPDGANGIKVTAEIKDEDSYRVQRQLRRQGRHRNRKWRC
jgi:hypothetical protein